MYSHYTGSWGCRLLFASLSKRLWSEYIEAWMNVWMHSLELSWDHLSWWFGWWMPPHAFTPGKLNTCSLFGWHSLGVQPCCRKWTLKGFRLVPRTVHVLCCRVAQCEQPASCFGCLLQRLPHSSTHPLWNHKPLFFCISGFGSWYFITETAKLLIRLRNTIFFWKTGLLAFTLWHEVIS